jgi:hypothetical protein
MIKMRVGAAFPTDSLDFKNSDFAVEQCGSSSAKELGLSVAVWLLDLRNMKSCTVTWKRTPARRMLVGIAVAEGGRWIRPFVRGACRTLSYAWLDMARKTNSGPQPDYVQCMIVDRPDNSPAGSGISASGYEVRANGALALIRPAPSTVREWPLTPDPRLPTFKPVEAGSPPDRKVDAASTESDAVRDGLRKALVEAATRLSAEQCNQAAKVRYVEAATQYANAWLKLMLCFGKHNCSASDYLRGEQHEKKFGAPWYRDVMSAARKVHDTGVIRENDFSEDTALFMANLASDPLINPRAEADTKAKIREARTPPSCAN